MIFQSHDSAEPLKTIGEQVAEIASTPAQPPTPAPGAKCSTASACRKNLFRSRYPHQLSGPAPADDRHRLRPEAATFIADNNAALDNHMRAEILDLLRDLFDNRMGLLLIS